MLPGLLPQALSSSDRSLVLEALRAMADGGEKVVSESIRGLAAAFLSDTDSAVRQAAVAADPPGVDWHGLLANETDSEVRSEVIIRLAKNEREQAIPDLVHLLHSSDWQVRAVAASCLITLGTAAAGAVKPLGRDADGNVRTAAVRILIALQEDAWLEQELLV